MKRKHKQICVAAAGMVLAGVCNAAPTPTADMCKEVFANNPSQCTTYDLSTATMSTTDDDKIYICTCTTCADGYHIGSGGIYKDYGLYYFHRANTCVKNDSTEGGGGTTTKTCSKGSLCTMCKGPNVTINGQIYCGMWADTNGVKTCSASSGGANVAYTMSPCCDSDGKAVGGATGCYVIACKTGMVASDAKTSCVCDVGYYGTTTTGCTRCPASGGTYGTTNGKGNTQITNCYFPAGLSIKDSVGTYQYTQDCYYSN